MPDLKSQILDLQSQNLTTEQIYARLLQQNFVVTDINQAFDSLEKTKIAETKKVSSFNFINILIVFGSLVIGIGLLSLVASNWSGMSNFVKIGLIIFLVLIFNLVGWFLLERKKVYYFGLVILFLGNISFGAGLFLIAQIFNLPVNSKEPFLFWLLACGSLILLTNSWYFKWLYLVISVFISPFVFSIDNIFYFFSLSSSYNFLDSFSDTIKNTNQVLSIFLLLSNLVLAYFLTKNSTSEQKQNPQLW